MCKIIEKLLSHAKLVSVEHTLYRTRHVHFDFQTEGIKNLPRARLYLYSGLHLPFSYKADHIVEGGRPVGGKKLRLPFGRF